MFFTMIRDSKQIFFDKIAAKFKSDSLSPNNWWVTLKTIIIPNCESTIPPLEFNGRIYTDDIDKATFFNQYFQGQTVLDDANANLRNLPPPFYRTKLSNITLTPLEVKQSFRLSKLVKLQVRPALLSLLTLIQPIATHWYFSFTL